VVNIHKTSRSYLCGDHKYITSKKFKVMAMTPVPASKSSTQEVEK